MFGTLGSSVIYWLHANCFLCGATGPCPFQPKTDADADSSMWKSCHSIKIKFKQYIFWLVDEEQLGKLYKFGTAKTPPSCLLVHCHIGFRSNWIAVGVQWWWPMEAHNNNNIIYGTPSRKSLACLQRHKVTLILLIHKHTTNTCITGDGLVEWEERKWQISMQREEVGFQGRGGFSVLS